MADMIENSIWIKAPWRVVERCWGELPLMHRWLNPMLRCEPEGETWSTAVGSRCRFMIRVPGLSPARWPTLRSVVVEREPGLVVWEFDGFFQGRDRWSCESEHGPGGQDEMGSDRTRLCNRFAFEIPNPLVAWGFRTVARGWTEADMRAQLERFKQVAEELGQE